MDLRAATEPIKATRIGLGIENDRKLLGLFWTTGASSANLHYNLQCTQIYDIPSMRRIPVFEEDGRVYCDGDVVELKEFCSYCTYAPDTDWQEWAVCKDDGRGFSEKPSEREAFIAENCEVCPVQLECLNYGASSLKNNQYAVWGGVYFSRRNKMKEIIEQQRQRLERGDDT